MRGNANRRAFLALARERTRQGRCNRRGLLLWAAAAPAGLWLHRTLGAGHQDLTGQPILELLRGFDDLLSNPVRRQLDFLGHPGNIDRPDASSPTTPECHVSPSPVNDM